MSGGAWSKAKGSAFERVMCSRLSLWVSNGKDDDLFWRSAMSGGRGTVRMRTRGAQRVSGDICSVAPGGHILTDYFFTECKHVKNMQFTSFVLKGKSWLASNWRHCVGQAGHHHKIPMLIVRQNLFPEIVLLPAASFFRDPVMVSPHHGCFVFMLKTLLDQPYVIPRLPLPADAPTPPLTEEEADALERARAYTSKRIKKAT